MLHLYLQSDEQAGPSPSARVFEVFLIVLNGGPFGSASGLYNDEDFDRANTSCADGTAGKTTGSLRQKGLGDKANRRVLAGNAGDIASG